MAEHKHFARTPYSAYHNPATAREDAELTHVERGSACGAYLRHFWQPVALSCEVGELPVKVRLFGEDLVLFRTRAGDVRSAGAALQPPGDFAGVRRHRGPRHQVLLS